MNLNKKILQSTPIKSTMFDQGLSDFVLRGTIKLNIFLIICSQELKAKEIFASRERISRQVED